MSKIILKIFKNLCRLYQRDYGRYSILTKIYYPHIAPKEDCYITSKIINKIRMKLNIKEYLQANLYLFGSYELSTLRFFKKYIHSGDTIFDVGANIGFISLFCSKVTGDSGTVYSFEPEEKNYKDFCNNIQLNNTKNIKPIKTAVSDAEKTLKFYLSNTENAGIHSTIYNERTLSKDYIEVKAITLDKLVKDNNINKINLVKIDVEGAELEVINGMKSILKNIRPIMIIELVQEILKIRNYSPSQFKKLMLDEYKYKAYKINSNGSLSEEDILYENICDNIVFLPIDM